MTPRLSVGIMVKNQTKELRECLERLADTRAKIETEIIVHVDDSSTQDTFAVAKEFTDKVRYFKWIDDYSAIKNGIMDEAKGEWIWILDADEFACDTTPLIEFINSKEAEKYSIAQYYERNFFDKKRKIFEIQYAPRIYKASAKHRYINKVHEGVNIWGIKIKQLEMYVDHTGYIDINGSGKLAIRTVEVEREYKKTPEDLRVVASYADVLVGAIEDNTKQLIEILEKAVVLAAKRPEDMCSGYIFFKLAMVYAAKVSVEKAEEIAQKYEKIVKKTNYSLGEIYCLLAKKFCIQERYEDSIKYFEKYLEVYKKVENGTIWDIDKSMPSYNSLMVNERNIKDNISIYAIALAQTSQFEKAKEQLERKEMLGYNGEQMYKAWFILSMKTEDAKLWADKYIEKSVDDAARSSLRNALEKLITQKNLEEFSFKVMGELASLQDTIYDDIYIKFNGLRINRDFENSEKILIELAENSEGWAVNAFAYIIYRVIRDKIPMNKVINKNTVNKLCEGVQLAYCFDAEYKTLLKEYLEKNGQGKTLQEIRIQKDMMWQVVENELVNDNVDLDFFKDYTRILGIYATNVAVPEFFEEENLNCLSQELQLGIKMQQGIDCKEKADILGYIKCLKEIVKISPSMFSAVSMLLEEVKEESEKQDKIVTELESLAANIKAMLNQLILQKDKANAMVIFQKLQEIVPDDKELQKIYIKIHNIE